MNAQSDEKIGQNLKTLRAETPQSEVASYMRGQGYKWSQNTVWQVENGTRPLRMTEALALANYFNTNISRFTDEPAEVKMGSFVADSFADVRKSYLRFVRATTEFLTKRIDYWTDFPVGSMSQQEEKELHELRIKRLESFKLLSVWEGLREASKDAVEERPELEPSYETSDFAEEITGVKQASKTDPLKTYFTYLSPEKIEKIENGFYMREHIEKNKNAQGD